MVIVSMTYVIFLETLTQNDAKRCKMKAALADRGSARTRSVYPTLGTYVVKIQNLTPPKINMEHNHGGLEDHFPF